jgi:hypothetical protein
VRGIAMSHDMGAFAPIRGWERRAAERLRFAPDGRGRTLTLLAPSGPLHSPALRRRCPPELRPGDIVILDLTTGARFAFLPPHGAIAQSECAATSAKPDMLPANVARL